MLLYAMRDCLLASLHPKAALAVKKAPGARLGNPINIREAGNTGQESLIAAADANARSLLLVLRALRAEGTVTIGGVTRALNERKIPVPRGDRWHVSSVANLLVRAQKLEAVR